MRQPLRTIATTIATLGVAALLLGSAGAVAGASAPTKDKPPVKISGDVNDHGVGKVKNDAVEVEADDFYFQKTYIKGKAGTTVDVEVKNEGSATHTFTIDSQDVNQELAPGKSVSVEVKIPKNGKPAPFYCRFHKSSGMQGAFFSTAGAKAGGSSSSSGGSNSNNGGGYGY
jgi:plastocyanin